jgi:hypothetical protein
VVELCKLLWLEVVAYKLASWWLGACRQEQLYWGRHTQGWVGQLRLELVGVGPGCKLLCFYYSGTAAWLAQNRRALGQCKYLTPGAEALAMEEEQASCKQNQGWG